MGYGNYPDLTKVKKILIIKLRHLGDVLLTAPLLSILQSHLPNALIDVYIYEESTPMLSEHPAVNKIIGYNSRYKKKSFLTKVLYELKILKKIRKENYDLVINLTEGDRGAIAAKASKAPIKVGIDSGGKRKKKIYTHIVKQPGQPRHTVEKNLDALRRIGIFPKESEKKLEIAIPNESKKNVEKLLHSYGIQLGKYILIHPATRWKFKGWKEEKFCNVIDTLLSNGEKVILTCGKDEEEIGMLNRIATKFSAKECLSLAGKINLKELAYLIALSSVCVTVDTVVLHLASAMKAKTVVLFGPSSEKNWGPWQNRYAKVVTKDFPCRPCFMDGCGGSKRSACLEEIEEKEVLDAIYMLKDSPK